MAIISTSAVEVSIQAVLPASIDGRLGDHRGGGLGRHHLRRGRGILGVGQAGEAAKCQQEEKDPNEVRRSHACIPQL